MQGDTKRLVLVGVGADKNGKGEKESKASSQHKNKHGSCDER